MSTVKGTVIQFVMLGVMGIALGLTVNAVRAKDKIDLRKDYFRRQFDIETSTQGTSRSNVQDLASGDAETEETSTTSVTSDTSEPPTKQLEHQFQEVSFADFKAIYEDPDTAAGGTVILDARSQAAYEEGHIPGAFQIDHYRLGEYDSDYIDYLLQIIEGAERVIVHCNGGDCEDSIFVCGDLIEWDVPYDKIYLYAGGFAEWKQKGMCIETGKGDDK